MVSFRQAWTAIAGILLAGSPLGYAHANEGQWMPQQIEQLDAQMLRRLGLQLDAHALWNPTPEGIDGVMGAVVNLSGCSAGFVSATGLVITNHHCAYRAIQKASDVDHDYLRDGFLARSHQAAQSAQGTTILVPERVTDVTDKILAVTAAHADPLIRMKEVTSTKKALTAACESATAHRRCHLASFYNGRQYQLWQYLEIEDVRLVYAPPSAVGDFGGEVDNWMWPRHTSDVSLLRAYVDPSGTPAPYNEQNVPYQPRTFLPVSTDGLKPGAFVATLGYPGRTDRHLPATQVRRRIEQWLPARAELYRTWVSIFEAQSQRDAAVRIKVAATLRSMANREKNARGMLAGANRLEIVKRRETEETRMRAWAEQQAAPALLKVLDRLQAIADAQRSRFHTHFLLAEVHNASGALANAIDIVRWAKERQKPDAERQPRYMDRNRRRLETTILGRTRDFDTAVDRATLTAWLERVASLPADMRPPYRTASEVTRMLRRPPLADATTTKALLDAANWAEIVASRDPLVQWAREIVDALESQERDDRRLKGELLVLGPRYIEMLEGVREGPTYPDANGTLRWSYGTVAGYRPRDGLIATPQTTLAGVLAKHTGEAPFNLPKRVREAAVKARTFIDPLLRDVPVNTLTTCDTTGGNSGSPVIDGHGRLVGLNFDRVWENVAGDFGYSIDRSRNIIVDIRYVLWQLTEVEHATELLDELGVDRRATATATGPSATGPAEIGLSSSVPADPPRAPSACACTVEPTRTFGTPAFVLVVVLMGLKRRRKPRAPASQFAS